MQVDYSDSKDYRGTPYYKVTHKTIKTYADLKIYLEDLFADDIVNQMLLNTILI
jgi:hypothetical protein